MLIAQQMGTTSDIRVRDDVVVEVECTQISP